MPQNRPAIPRALDRAVRVEAGHRCAIPTCRVLAGLQIHHIEDYARVREHKFENLILLCANCHSLATSGVMDRKAVKAYKANLTVLSVRYGDLERRVLEHFVQHELERKITLDHNHALLLKYLVDDDLLEFAGPARGAIAHMRGSMATYNPDSPADTHSLQPGREDVVMGPAVWQLTADGVEVVARLREARTLE